MVKNILISQHKPLDFEKSPYNELVKKYNVNINFCKFFNIEPVDASTFRKSKVNISEHTSAIFMSKNAIDHFFRISKELRIEIPPKMKFFCINETTAFYLQKFITYRKRKIFIGNNDINELVELANKHKNEKFLLPSSDLKKGQLCLLLEKNDIEPTIAVIFNNVYTDLKNTIDINNYEMIVLFSPHGVHSLKENFPDFVQGEKIIGVLGENVAAALKETGLKLDFMAPTKKSPSIISAIDLVLKKTNKKPRKVNPEKE